MTKKKKRKPYIANFKINSRVLFCIAFMVFHVKFNVQSSSIKEGPRVALLLSVSLQAKHL